MCGGRLQTGRDPGVRPDSFCGIVLKGRQEVDGDVIFVSAYGEKAGQRDRGSTVEQAGRGRSCVRCGRRDLDDRIRVTAANKILDDLTA
jgi:hypothetical protein